MACNVMARSRSWSLLQEATLEIVIASLRLGRVEIALLVLHRLILLIIAANDFEKWLGLWVMGVGWVVGGVPYCYFQKYICAKWREFGFGVE